MAKALKLMLSAQLQDALKDSASGLMVIDPGPMTVESAMEFRKDLREKAGGARLRIVHNRTARAAMQSLQYEDSGDDVRTMLAGPSAVVYGGDGPIPIARVVRDWRLKLKKLKIKGAVADGEVMSREDAEGLADMPDLHQLHGMLAGAIASPARGIAASLAAMLSGMARVIQAHVDEQGGVEASDEGEAAPAADAPAADGPEGDAPEGDAAEAEATPEA
jgi:large subunit ribosomal protein L10